MTRTLQVGVKALIQDEQGKILLLQRSKPFHGEDFCRWDIPGGRIDTEETQEAALRREVKEETNLTLGEIVEVFHVQDILFDPKLHVVRVTYRVKASGEVSISEEHTDARWFRIDEIPRALTDLYFTEALQVRGWLPSHD